MPRQKQGLTADGKPKPKKPGYKTEIDEDELAAARRAEDEKVTVYIRPGLSIKVHPSKNTPEYRTQYLEEYERRHSWRNL